MPHAGRARGAAGAHAMGSSSSIGSANSRVSSDLPSSRNRKVTWKPAGQQPGHPVDCAEVLRLGGRPVHVQQLPRAHLRGARVLSGRPRAAGQVCVTAPRTRLPPGDCTGAPALR